MSEFANWFPPTVMRPLGWALVHFLWQGLALAALLSLALTICHRASTRYVAAMVTLLLMVAAPVITFFVFWHGGSAVSASWIGAASASAVSLSHRVSAFAPSGAALAQSPTSSWPSPWQSSRPDALLWFVEAWFSGVLFLSLRTVGGFVLIERMRRKEARHVSANLNELCVSLQRRLHLDRAIRYCECRRLEAPAVIGWFRPVVMLPMTVLTGLSESQLKAVIAHELAHIRRLDCFVNLFQVAAETLLFYHPAIWWVNKRIRNERENCCDDVAISVCGDAVEYARALTLMEESRTAPALAMAANRGPLATRVARLLGLGTIGSGIRVTGFAASFVFLAGALFAGSALLGAAHVSFASTALPVHQNAETELVGGASPAALAIPNASPAAKSSSRPNATSDSRTQANSNPQTSADPVAENAPQDAAQKVKADRDAEQDKNTGGYLAGLKAEGFDNLTADQVIAMKIQGVTPEYIHEIHALGLHPSVDELVGMRVQGLTPQYIRDMRAAGIDVKTDELIGMKVQGITPEYVKNMQGLGLKFTPEELVGMKVQGVSGEYIRDMRAAGMDGDVDRFIGMKVQGVTPEYVKKMESLGLKVTPDEIVGLKVQGVSPEYVSEMRAAGFDGDVDRIIGMKVQGVTPEYVKSMQSLGLKFSGDQLIGMKVQGVSPEYIRDMRATGIDGSVDQFIGMKVQGVTPEYVRDIRATGLNPTARQIVAMRVQGVDADYVKGLKAAGLQNLTVEDCIRAKVSGITPDFIAKARSQGFKDLDLRKLIALRNAGVF
ncbi:MAG TPA: M56 family metallopeptidase [Candidatus Acidoferrales bacterium]|nr:M56 family metallopeptidase [Candidatus Acidoferrales bacterium]